MGTEFTEICVNSNFSGMFMTNELYVFGRAWIAKKKWNCCERRYDGTQICQKKLQLNYECVWVLDRP